MPISWRRCRRCAGTSQPGSAPGGGRPAAGGFTAPGPGVKLGEHGAVSGHPAAPHRDMLPGPADPFRAARLCGKACPGRGARRPWARVRPWLPPGRRRPEAIVDGVNGFLVAPGDPEALARGWGSYAATRRPGNVWGTWPGAPSWPSTPWRPCCSGLRPCTWNSAAGAIALSVAGR